MVIAVQPDERDVMVLDNITELAATAAHPISQATKSGV